MQVVQIELPAVNPKLHAHNKGHWTAKKDAVKHLRAIARTKARQLLPRDFETWERATVDYLFVLPCRRRRDYANLIQSQKPAIDGIADAKLIVDDDWKHLEIGSVKCVVDKSSPMVVLTFRKGK